MKTNFLSKECNDAIMNDKEVIAVLLFGSYARGEKYRDIDICLVLDKKYDNLQMSKKRLNYAALVSSKIDIQIFQQLPLYIRKRILKEMKVLQCKNEDLLYEIAFATIKEFVYYEKIYNTHLKAIEEAA